VCYNCFQPDFFFESDPIKVDVNFANTISPHPLSGTTYGIRHEPIVWQEQSLVPNFGQARMVTFCELYSQTTGVPINPLFMKSESWTCLFGDDQPKVFSIVEEGANLLLNIRVPRKRDTTTVPVTFSCSAAIGSVVTNNLKFTYVENVTATEDGRVSQKDDCREVNENKKVPNESLQGRIWKSPENTQEYWITNFLQSFSAYAMTKNFCAFFEHEFRRLHVRSNNSLIV
jgi:hypothetical protein